ncbi:MAG: hypothetical protein MUQ10_14075 [Anaerolineae bacterium]|nr:hypothetical protein [Anaerolineae bacterium]
MNRSQIATIAILTALALFVFVAAVVLIGQGTRRMEEVAAYKGSLPTVTGTPTATPIATWTPTPVVMSPRSDPESEITRYFEECSPLLTVHWALKTEMAELYGTMRGGRTCSSGSSAVETRSRSVIAAQDQLKYSMAALVPPRAMRRVHEYLISSIAHDERANLFIFKGCLEFEDPWWSGADIELRAADAEWEKARVALDEVLQYSGVELGDNPLLPPEAEQ